jgi:hypothetical protein
MYNIIFHIWSRCVSKLYICGNPLKTVFSPCVPARHSQLLKLGGRIEHKKKVDLFVNPVTNISLIGVCSSL